MSSGMEPKRSDSLPWLRECIEDFDERLRLIVTWTREHQEQAITQNWYVARWSMGGPKPFYTIGICNTRLMPSNQHIYGWLIRRGIAGSELHRMAAVFVIGTMENIYRMAMRGMIDPANPLDMGSDHLTLTSERKQG